MKISAAVKKEWAKYDKIEWVEMQIADLNYGYLLLSHEEQKEVDGLNL